MYDVCSETSENQVLYKFRKKIIRPRDIQKLLKPKSDE